MLVALFCVTTKPRPDRRIISFSATDLYSLRLRSAAVTQKIITMEGIVAYVVGGNNKTRHASTKVQCPPLSDGTGEGKKGSFAKTIS